MLAKIELLSVAGAFICGVCLLSVICRGHGYPDRLCDALGLGVGRFYRQFCHRYSDHSSPGKRPMVRGPLWRSFSGILITGSETPLNDS